MTLINIDKLNDVIVVSASGHADYSKENDIVCAGISTITQSLLQTLKYYELEGKCSVSKEKMNEELGCCLFSFTSYDNTVIDAILNMALIGYTMLENAYPDNISVNVNI